MPVSTLNTQPNVETKIHTSYRPGTVAIFIAVVTLAILAPAVTAAQDEAPSESPEAVESTEDSESADEASDEDEKRADQDDSEGERVPEDDADDAEEQADAAQDQDDAAQDEDEVPSPEQTAEDSEPETTDETPAQAERAEPADATPEKAPEAESDSEETADEPAEKTADAPTEETADEPAVETASKGADEASDKDAAGAEGNVQAGYDDGFYVQTVDGNHKLELSGGFTPRLSVTDVEEPSDEGDEYQFVIPRVRVKVSGHVFTPRLSWEVGMGLAGRARLLSANIEYEILKDALSFYAGQDRLPYMREQLTSHWKLHFAERSIVEEQFGESREPGVALQNFKRDGFEWTVGVYNGVKSDLPTNPPADIAERQFEPSIVARAGWSSKGLNGYKEADLEGGPFRFGVGVTALSQLALPEEAERADKVGVDVVLKAHGFSFVAAGHTAARSAGEGFFNQEIFVTGVRAQAGYVIASRFEPVVRYAAVIPRADDTSTQEARGGLNVYFHGHRVKMQVDAGTVTRRTPGVESTDWSGRVQGVLRF